MSAPTGGRPLKGSLTRSRSGWTVEVPARRGAPQRVRRTFGAKRLAEAWRAEAIAALMAGEPLPDPDARAAPSPTPTSAAGIAAARMPTAAGRGGDGPTRSRYPHEPTLFEQIARQWHHERHVQLNHAGGSRVRDVLSTIEVRLAPRLRALGVDSGGDLTRAQYLELMADLAGTRPPGESLLANARAGEWLTTVEAITRTGTSRSTIKRRIRDGAFPRSYLDDAGNRWICEGDLLAAGLITSTGAGTHLRRGPHHEGYTQSVITSTLRVLDRVLLYGESRGIDAWTLAFDPRDIDNPRSTRPEAPARRQVTIADGVLLAEHLHPVHQVALWIMRVMGLRISEAYGLHVDDIIDVGDRGLMIVRRQGGGGHLVRDRDGRLETVNEVDNLKNRRSERALVVPGPLMSLLHHSIDVFLRDLDGHVDPQARLIPGLVTSGSGGPNAFRTALGHAAQAVGLDMGTVPTQMLRPRPHDLRKGMVTDLAWTEGLDDYARRRFAGHAPGTDVHATVYVLDHPEFKPLIPIAEALERELAAAAPPDLIVPTAVSCTTGVQLALAARRHEIDEALETLGWYQPATVPGSELLTAQEIAALLDVTVVTAREWLRDGIIPSAVIESHPRGDRRGARLQDVLDHQAVRAARLPIARLAAHLGQTPDRLRGWATKANLPLTIEGDDEIVPPATEQALRDLAAAEHELLERALTIAPCANVLGISAARVNQLIQQGALHLDSQAGADRLRYVTRDSVDALRAQMVLGG